MWNEFFETTGTYLMIQISMVTNNLRCYCYIQTLGHFKNCYKYNTATELLVVLYSKYCQTRNSSYQKY